MAGVKILQGDCRDVLKGIEENSVDSIVCDPPYEISFMNKGFDKTGVAHDITTWKECLRVLKPGGYCLAFGGTRTYHRLACAIEDAGFECRDVVSWCYGSGFPKSLDVAQAIEKSETTGLYRRPDQIRNVRRVDRGSAAGAVRKGADVGAEEELKGKVELTVDTAKQWDGWGTALKPAMELVCVARKPLSEKTVAANCLKWGTGALNIDGCRIHGGSSNGGSISGATALGQSSGGNDHNNRTTNIDRSMATGRWPANVVHDGSEEVLAAFPNAPGQCADVKYDAEERKTQNIYGAMKRGHEPSAERTYEESGSTNFAMKPGARRLDSGSAARFFYAAKVSKSERGEGNSHPTLKPIALMRYLCKLVTPPGGVVLDPFCGSGSTGLAAMREGFDFIGIELSVEYITLINNRLLAEVLS